MGILLSAPITTKDSEQGEDALICYGTSTMQGWRTGMEDAHAHVLGFDKNSAFFAIFDGHGGFEVARYCARHMAEELTKAPSYAKGEIPQAMKEAYISVDRNMATPAGNKELGDIHTAGISSSEAREEGMMGGMKSGLKPDGVGCTAVSAFFKDGLLYCANSGDSRCVLSRNGQPIAMSNDHKPDLPDERRRILDAGGFVTNGRVNGNLNLSRAIGDQDYKRDKTLPPERQIITCVPDISMQKIREDEDEFVVLACDGIWDCMSNQQVVSFVRSRLLPELAASSTNATSPTPALCPVKRTADGDDQQQDEQQQQDQQSAEDKEKEKEKEEATLIAATSPTELLKLICESVLDRCLAPSSAMGIGCDNMSMTIIMPKGTKFGKAVLARFANAQQPAATAATSETTPADQSTTVISASATVSAAPAPDAKVTTNTGSNGQDGTAPSAPATPNTTTTTAAPTSKQTTTTAAVQNPSEAIASPSSQATVSPQPSN